MTTVKRSNKRSEKAKATRARIIEAARELFLERGYGATPLQEIADRAGVAVQTIYFVFGNKRTLLKELVDVTVAGDHEPTATTERPWFHSVLDAETADEQLRIHVHGSREVLERVAPLVQMVDTAAATDADVAEMWPADQRPRYEVQDAAAQALVTKPGARPDITAEHAADILFAVLSTEMFLLLVHIRHWTADQWEQWSYLTLRAHLCADVSV
ncbi:TetR/AcrR family transcriptional regulator [Phytoactinopolyspora mesophila]|uniref:TetR family transcriptional regulator n=1 Tax=Phytoactinopolyspora mesophila TaxID=2650750 RepID=A0A7K3M0L8_9ACTN|nr:TetR/AcrR family transcriptional regulator [Phytoactinopolyspora mesophila]NDL56843.1 TetR family transcriptional regulator [Phytoactinopolyspora mesophila]